MSQVLVQTRVPESVAAVLREQAVREERSVASVVRLVLRDYVEQKAKAA